MYLKKILSGMSLGVFAVLIIGCAEEPQDSIFDANAKFAPDPVIASVSPDSALSGVDIVTIAGENFSEVPEENSVYFNKTKATVSQASQTSLQMIAPNIFSDSVVIKVDVKGSLEFATYVPYKVTPASRIFTELLETDDLYGIAVDKNKHVFASVGGKFIKKFNVAGEQAKIFEWKYQFTNTLNIGPDGRLYGGVGGRTKFVVAIDTTDGTTEEIASVSEDPVDLDFDDSGDILAALSSKVIRIDNAGNTSDVIEFSDFELIDIRYFDGGLLLLGQQPSTDEYLVLEASIDGSSTDVLGNVTSTYGDTVEVYSMEVDQDGAMYLSTNKNNPILVLQSGGGFSTLYKGVIPGPMYDLKWGYSTFMFAAGQITSDSETLSAIYVIDTRNSGAPRWGRN